MCLICIFKMAATRTVPSVKIRHISVTKHKTQQRMALHLGFRVRGMRLCYYFVIQGQGHTLGQGQMSFQLPKAIYL